MSISSHNPTHIQRQTVVVGMAPQDLDNNNNIIEVLQKSASPTISQQHEPNPKWWMWKANTNKEDDEKEKEEEESWEVKAFAEDTRNTMMGGSTWPPRSYTCTYCRREFRSAQALGGHMNVHRRDRARLHHPPPSSASTLIHHHYPNINANAASGLCLLVPNFSSPSPSTSTSPLTPPISTTPLPSFSPNPNPNPNHHHYPPNYFDYFPSPTPSPSPCSTKFHLLPSSHHHNPHEDLDLELRL